MVEGGVVVVVEGQGSWVMPIRRRHGVGAFVQTLSRAFNSQRAQRFQEFGGYSTWWDYNIGINGIITLLGGIRREYWTIQGGTPRLQHKYELQVSYTTRATV